MKALESEIWKIEKIKVKVNKDDEVKEIVKYNYSKCFPKNKTVSELLRVRLNNSNFPGYVFSIVDDNRKEISKNKILANIKYCSDIYEEDEILLNETKKALKTVRVKSEKNKHKINDLSIENKNLKSIIWHSNKLAKMVKILDHAKPDIVMAGRAKDIANYLISEITSKYCDIIKHNADSEDCPWK